MGLWTDHSNAVIRGVLDTLPTGATEEEARKALSASYPFGERAMHPYKAWLKAVKTALAREYGRRVKPGSGPEVRLVVRPGLGNRARVDVVCGWCKDRRDHYNRAVGCLVCGRARERLQAVAPWRRPEFGPLAAAALTDPVARGVLLDWLEEVLGERPA